MMKFSSRISGQPLTLAICGWSGSGKTTLIERVLPRLSALGWRVGVWKHDAHRMEVDAPGKDTDRFYQAGAVLVVGEDATQRFLRIPLLSLETAGDRPALEALDLWLVEGHKQTPLPKIWLNGGPGAPPAPDHLEAVVESLDRGEDLTERAAGLIENWTRNHWAAREKGTAVLVGGRSIRMGSPKTLLKAGGKTLLEGLLDRVHRQGEKLVLVGRGAIPDAIRERYPILPDIEEGQGPLAGLLALMRWAPDLAWTVLSCDLPAMNRVFLDWLDGNRGPGSWAVIPTADGGRLEPLAAVYEPALRNRLEEAWAEGERSLQKVLRGTALSSPRIPEEMQRCVTNVNTPLEWEQYCLDLEDTEERG